MVARRWAGASLAHARFAHQRKTMSARMCRFARHVALGISALGVLAWAGVAQAQNKPAPAAAPIAAPAADKPKPSTQDQNKTAAPQDRSSNQQAGTAPVSSSPAESCYAGYGLKYQDKISVCTQAIQSGAVKEIPLALAYFSRGQAFAATGNQKGSQSDYRQSLKIFTDVIRVSAPSAPIIFQRGLIYHTMGDADQAIVDYSDAIRLAPNETYAYVNRGIVLYTKKDNNEGAISDFNSALKLKPCEVNAWINRGLTYKRKGDLNQSIADFTDALKCLGGNLAPVSLTPPANADAAYFQGVQNSSQGADAHYQRGLVYI